jgi:hypothetical protein
MYFGRGGSPEEYQTELLQQIPLRAGKTARMFFRKASTLQLILVDAELKAFASAVRGKRVKVSVKRGNDRTRII